MNPNRWGRALRVSSILGLILGLMLLVCLMQLVIPDTRQAMPAHVAQAAGNDFPNCRFGVGVAVNTISTYAIEPMRIGWYMDWWTRLSPVKPGGIDYYHTLTVKQDVINGVRLSTYHITPTLDASAGGLGPIIQANPGAVWIVGNEPDSITQGNLVADVYAQAYHEAYQFIKSIDPTARVAIGAVIQPTPLRLQYLDAVLEAYQTRYAASLPVDIWNVHLYIIQEAPYDYGARVPPAFPPITGTLYTRQDHVNIAVFRSLVVQMRTWMKARGYQDKPLIITEYGVLMPLWFLDDVGITQTDIDNFLANAITYMNSAADVNLGYAADGYQLVQQAAVYSLDDDGVFPPDPIYPPDETLYRWGSFLFRSTAPYTRTSAGNAYAVTMSNLTATVDLVPHRWTTSPSSIIISPTDAISPTFSVWVANAGNSAPPVPVKVSFFDVTGGNSTALGQVLLPPFTGCGTQRQASVTWRGLTPGVHKMRVEVDPDAQIGESLENNNVVTATVLIGTEGIYLPFVSK